MRTRFRTIWISDTHLGSAGSRAEELAIFLKHVTCDRLYLVGDIVDMWRLRQKWSWPQDHNVVVRRILKLASRGTEIIYIPGNHDDAARPYTGMVFGGVRIALNAAHQTADGRHLLVCHGDQYDLVVQNSRLLALLGAHSYEVLLKINRLVDAGRSLLGLPRGSLARRVKLAVKSACTYVSRFEEELQAEAKRGGFDGVVCGHIHKASSERLANGIHYYNCGDWVEGCTALVEDDNGHMAILDAVEFNARATQAAIVEDDIDAWPSNDPPFAFPARACA